MPTPMECRLRTDLVRKHSGASRGRERTALRSPDPAPSRQGLRPLAAKPRRTLPPLVINEGQQGEVQGYDASVDEESMLRIAGNLPPQDRSKALKLWEEHKRMRTKLAILEGISELPARQRIRALELLRDNQSLRDQTGLLLPAWADLEDTIGALLEAEEEALETFDSSHSGDSPASPLLDRANGSIAELLADPDPDLDREPEPEYDPSWRFWDTGLGAAGVQSLAVSDAALALALKKAEAMVETRNVDEILNNYWSVQLNVPPPPLQEQAFLELPQQPAVAPDTPAAPTPAALEEIGRLASESASAAQEEIGRLASESAIAAQEEIGRLASESASAAPEAAPEPLPPPPTPSPPAAQTDIPDPQLQVAGQGMAGPGVMAAAAGLGAGMLALAVGMEAATAMEIMATTALVTSAGSLLGSNEAAKDLRRRGAGAPALVAIATALNAADTLSKTIDHALESGRARTVAQAADSAAKMFTVVGKSAVAGAGRAVAAASSVVVLEPTAASGIDLPRRKKVSPLRGTEAESLIVFSVEKELMEGLCMKVVGTANELGSWDGSFGSWDCSQGLSMQLDGTGTWVAVATVPLGAHLEFALASHPKGQESGDVEWESVFGGTRALQVEAPTAFVTCEWGDPQVTQALLGEEAKERMEQALHPQRSETDSEPASIAKISPAFMMPAPEAARSLDEPLKPIAPLLEPEEATAETMAKDQASETAIQAADQAEEQGGQVGIIQSTVADKAEIPGTGDSITTNPPEFNGVGEVKDVGALEKPLETSTTEAADLGVQQGMTMDISGDISSDSGEDVEEKEKEEEEKKVLEANGKEDADSNILEPVHVEKPAAKSSLLDQKVQQEAAVKVEEVTDVQPEEEAAPSWTADSQAVAEGEAPTAEPEAAAEAYPMSPEAAQVSASADAEDELVTKNVADKDPEASVNGGIEELERPPSAADGILVTDQQDEVFISLTGKEEAEQQEDVEHAVAAYAQTEGPVSRKPLGDTSVVPNRSPGELEDTQAFAMFLDALAAPEDEGPVTPPMTPVAGASADEKVAGVVLKSPLATARVVFAVKKELAFGQGMAVVGSCQELGNWDSAHAVSMKWRSGNIWVGEATIPTGTHQFKFVVTDSSSGAALYWETSGAGNRIMQVPEGAATVFTEGEFGLMDESSVSVDDDLDARIAAMAS